MTRINHTSQSDAGNILFFTVLIFASILINRASRCIDETGVIIICGILSGHSLFNFLIWTVYIPGVHRLLLKSCICCIERCSPVLFIPGRLSRQTQLSEIWQLNEVWHCCMFETMHLQLPAPICAQEEPQIHVNNLAEPQPAPAERASAVLELDFPPETEHQELLSGASSEPCDNCENRLASEYCKTCKDWLCAECANTHREYQAGRTRSRHRMVPADQQLEDETKTADVLQNLDDKQLRVEVVTLMADGIRQTVISTLRHSPALSSTLQQCPALSSTLHNS